MDQMLNSIIEHPVASGAGIFGMVCLAAYPMFRSRPFLLTAYLANNFGFATHYALLGDGTAELMNTVIGAQTLVAVSLVRWPVLRWLYYALMMVSFGGAAITWHGWPSFFASPQLRSLHSAGCSAVKRQCELLCSHRRPFGGCMIF